MSYCRWFCTLLLATCLPAFGAAPRAGENGGGNASEKAGAAGLPGQLDFQTDLFAGRFGYRVPLELAPGRHGHTPALSLAYNSANANGWCGVGWELDLGFIQRQTKFGVPVRWANGRPLRAYDDVKGFTFSLHGQAAALVSVGDHEYRAEIEGGFLRFLFQTNANQWLVIDKGGNQYWFGTSGASRMSNAKTGWPSNAWSGTYRWALCHVESALGDTVDYTYTNFAGALYPLKLSYNGHVNGLPNSHTVDFILQTRGDVTLSYLSGYRVEQNQRLVALVHKVGTQVVWSNRLAYAQSESTGRSLLQSLRRYGTNLTSSLPPLTFAYSQQAFGFQPPALWTNLYLPPGDWRDYPNGDFTWVTASDTLGHQIADVLDMDGDGLPDRVLANGFWGPWTNLWVQHNNGAGFDAPVSLGRLSIQNYYDGVVGALSSSNNPSWGTLNAGNTRLLDLNGDGYPDRVTDPLESLSITAGGGYQYPYTNLMVQVNAGSAFQGTNDVKWTNVFSRTRVAGAPATNFFLAIEGGAALAMCDLNGDGLPDRVMGLAYGSPLGVFTNYLVQFNTGAGFTGTNVYSFPAYHESQEPQNYGASVNSGAVRLLDLNGDGLPDRVLAPTNTADLSFTNFVVEFNNGCGFEPPVAFGGLMGAYTNWPLQIEYTSAVQDSAFSALRDMNCDGLPDHVLRYRTVYDMTNWLVQINRGTNFGPPEPYGPYYSQGLTANDAYTAIQGLGGRLIDLNGDGIPDHVMPAYPISHTNYLAAELSKGPMPDLLITLSNGIGGSVGVAYKPSTQYNNRETAGGAARGLLPFPVQTVASVWQFDGIHPPATNSYSYEGGFWSSARREFHGFARVSVADPLGLTNVHWFHQAGGRDHSAYGEYQDSAASIGKNGLPFRVETLGADGRLYKLALNKVEDADLGNGRHFGYVSQSLELDYPGNGSAVYRATARQFGYDLATGNLTNTTDYGEVTNVNVAAHSFTDTPNTDSVYQFTLYAALANTNILDKPQRTILASDAAGQSLLRESLFAYDGQSGNLTQERRRMCPSCYLTNSFGYGSYNNRTSATDEAGVTTTTVFDSGCQTFPASQTVAGQFTSTFSYDARSGKLLGSTDAKGLVTLHALDPFLRLAETKVSTTANGPAELWLARYDYRLGMAGGYSTNSVRQRRNDGLDTANGHESWTYLDGLGRPLQVREEAEANGFRVTDTVYDPRGSVKFEALPYFSSGTNYSRPTATELGVLRLYDPVGRLSGVAAGVNATFSAGRLTGTAGTGGDTGSPLGTNRIAYAEGNDPWTILRTDEEGKVHKYLLDAYGRTNQIVEVAGGNNYLTRLGYNPAGDLTSITDNANNQIQYGYNDLGQLVAMADPDMGVWQYRRDYAGRLREQVDANGQLVRFCYDDPLGRLRSRQVYDFTGAFAYGVTNYYDGSAGDSAYTVYPGQLYLATDSEGWQKHSYDVRGRVLKSVRYLAKNGQTYTNLFSYDEADRLTQTAYPNGGPTVTNIFDSGGNLWQVKQAGGAGTAYYTARGFNALGQLLAMAFGNNTLSTNQYYPNSARLKRLTTNKVGGTNLQDLAYTYDRVSNLKSITDGVYSGSASATLSGLVYDDLHRLTSLTRPAVSQTTAFSYNSLGNLVVNGEFGPGAYNYGVRMPHAVKSANGTNYAYDANGNMLVRGNQRLAYDPENRLAYVATASSVTSFGYDAAGARLWKQGTNSLQVWMGGNYEEKNGQTLFHILAGGRLVCTFDSTGTNVFAYYHPDHLRSTAIETDQNGNRIQHYEYMAFGQDRFTESSSAFPVSKRYTSQVKDADTGLYYYGARYYDPLLGRFIQPDSLIPSLGEPQDLNRYTYTLNNPLKYTDPSGHQGVPVGRPGLITEEIRGGLAASFRPGPSSAVAREMQYGSSRAQGEARVVQMEFEFGRQMRQNTREFDRNYVRRPTTPSASGVPQISQLELIPREQVISGGSVAPGSQPSLLNANAVQTATSSGSADTIAEGLRVSPYRVTTPGETFFHYGYAENAPNFQSGLRPGGFATSIGNLPGAEAQNGLALPAGRPVPNAVYTVTPEAGTWVRANPVAEPLFGRPGGLPEYQFPRGTAPGTVSIPRPIQPK